jgi:hypothetical protein
MAHKQTSEDEEKRVAGENAVLGGITHLLPADEYRFKGKLVRR